MSPRRGCAPSGDQATDQTESAWPSRRAVSLALRDVPRRMVLSSEPEARLRAVGRPGDGADSIRCGLRGGRFPWRWRCPRGGSCCHPSPRRGCGRLATRRRTRQRPCGLRGGRSPCRWRRPRGGWSCRPSRRRGCARRATRRLNRQSRRGLRGGQFPWPVATSQRRMVLSFEPEARLRPSGDQATDADRRPPRQVGQDGVDRPQPFARLDQRRQGRYDLTRVRNCEWIRAPFSAGVDPSPIEDDGESESDQPD